MQDEFDPVPTPLEAEELLRVSRASIQPGSNPFEFGPELTAEEMIAWMERSLVGLH